MRRLDKAERLRQQTENVITRGGRGGENGMLEELFSLLATVVCLPIDAALPYAIRTAVLLSTWHTMELKLCPLTCPGLRLSERISNETVVR